jgi:hypothetical protein
MSKPKSKSKSNPGSRLAIGLSKEKVISDVGEPDRIKYIKISFRPPKESEQKSDYQGALKDWERQTVGEILVFDDLQLEIDISKAGHVMTWRRLTGQSSADDGLVAIKPEGD